MPEENNQQTKPNSTRDNVSVERMDTVTNSMPRFETAPPPPPPPPPPAETSKE